MLEAYTKKIGVMPEDDRARALAHYKQAAKYKRQKMKHKYMAHLLRGDQYMRASALAFGVPLEEPSGYGIGKFPDRGMVYWHGSTVEDRVIAAGFDEKNFDEAKGPAWKWEQSEPNDMSALDMVCHREITNDSTTSPGYSSKMEYQAVTYMGRDSDFKEAAFFVFRSKHIGTFISCNVSGLRAHLSSPGNTTGIIGAKDVDDLIEIADCARTALQQYPFIRSIEDWREGALLVQKHSKMWTRASLCEKFAYYDFALRRKKDVTSCTYTSNPKDTTGAVLIPRTYIVLDGGCGARGGVIDGIASIKMSRDESGAVFCNGAEMRSTSMVPDDDATVMSRIRAKFILGVSDITMNITKAKIEDELGAKSLLLERNPILRKQCERKKTAAKVTWPDIGDKLACTYTEASSDLKAEADKLRKAQQGGISDAEELIRSKYPTEYYKQKSNEVIAAAGSLVSSGASALGSGLYAGASALGLLPVHK
jgi:hypothetical protein